MDDGVHAAGSAYGPFHRLKSATQDLATALLQRQSGELWGATARWGGVPAVKAYRGILPASADGIEFFTFIAPSTGSHPYTVFWYLGDRGVASHRQGGTEFAKIPVSISKLVYRPSHGGP